MASKRRPILIEKEVDDTELCQLSLVVKCFVYLSSNVYLKKNVNMKMENEAF